MSKALHIRPLEVTDATEMRNVLAGPSLYSYTGGEPPSIAELERRYAVQVRGHSADASELWFNWIVTLGVDGPAIGYVQATVPAAGGSAQIAWVIGRSWQGHGYASGAVRLMLAELAAHEVTEVIAHIHPSHEASQRVAAAVGMRATATVVDGEVRWVCELGG